jgi:hypothetical protein
MTFTFGYNNPTFEHLEVFEQAEICIRNLKEAEE